MSESIDRRVVEMRFDNKDFENNVNTTMTVLEKLKEKLSFKGAGEKFESTSGLSSALDSVKSRFSALEVVGMTALINLTNSAINLGKNLAKSLTIDQVKAGFSEYELKMNSIQTIMASTGKDINTVNGYLNELNTYADKTIYSFSDMTASIGKFTNAGVDLDTAVKAIQGISNEAAVSGANAQEASRAMYNFAQALSAGYVKLIDWKSIENANMETKEFKQQLIDTAVAEGTLEKQSDGMYKVLTKGTGGGFKDTISATKNFNDSLSAAWMTTDVLTKTLGRYSDATTDIGKKAFAAAQDVKTFTQLVDTVKESIGSGWAQSFEIIFGNLEEAKVLWTSVNNVISGFVNKTSDARNTVLQTWKDLGGRQDIANGLKTAFGALRDAYVAAFPAKTTKDFENVGKKLKGLTEGFADRMKIFLRLQPYFTDIFKAVGDVVGLLKDAFAGLFDVIGGGGGESALNSLITSFVAIVAWLSRGVSAVISFARASGIFKVIHKSLLTVNDVIFGIVDGLFALASGVSVTFSDLISPLDVFGKAADKAFSVFDGKKASIINTISGAIGKLFSLIGTGLSKLDFGKIGGLLAGGGIMAAALKIGKVADTVKEKLEGLFGKEGEKKGGLKSKIEDTLDGLSDTLNQFQSSLKVGQLVTIAISLGILAASCATLADIPAKKLATSVAAIGGLFTELGIASHLMKGAQTEGIIKMSIAVVILASAVKKMSEIESMGKGLIGVGVILGELTAFCLMFDRLKIKPEALNKTSSGLILMAIAINLLSKPVKELGAMDVGSLIKGLGAVAAMLTGFTLTAKAFTKIETKGLVKAGAAMVVMAVAIRMLAKPLAQLGGMDMKSLAKGLGGMAVALGELVGFAAVMGIVAKSSGNIMKASAALLVMSVGIKIMAGAINQMGADSGAGQGLSVMFGALVILAGAMALMQKSLPGAAAMIVVAGALAIMAPAIAILSSLNIGGVATGLLALAGTLTIFGVGAALLAPVIPLMIALAGAMALLGVGVLSLGAGITLLVAAFSMATEPIVEGATAISQAFPIIAKGIGEGIVTIIQTIGNSAEAIKTAFLQILNALITAATTAIPRLVQLGMSLLLALLRGIESNIGSITTTVANIIVNFVNALSASLPQIVDAGFNLMISFLDSMANAISENGDRLVTALENVILAALGSLAGLIPGFGKSAKKAIDGYRRGLEGGKNSTAKSAKGVASSVDNNLKLADQSGKGSKAARQLNNALNHGGQSAKVTAKTISSTVGTNLKVKDQTSNGANAVRGLKNGMEGLIGPLSSTASRIASIVDETIRKKNEIHSPARRLYRTGSYMMQGLINGLDSLTGTYQKRADNIATTMVSSMNKSIDQINEIAATGFKDDLNLNESISKALDISISMDKFMDRNSELNRRLDKLTSSLNGVTDTMNSRQMVNNIHVDGSEDPELFADKLVRSMRLNARTI
jgi:tape measure domain-containing protein